MKLHPRMLAASIGALLLPSFAQAEPVTARERWQQQGAKVEANYTGEYAHNLSGGTRSAHAFAGQLFAAAHLDLQALAGWDGMHASAALSLRNGQSLGARADLPLLMQSQEVYGRGNILRLGQLWVGKYWERASVKAGRMPVGQDFNALRCESMSLAFCGSQPAMVVGDYWFNAPVSQWALVGELKPAATTYVRGGIYQINPTYAESSGGMRLAPKGTRGTLTPFEFGWAPAAKPGRSSLYVLGGWYSNAKRAAAQEHLSISAESYRTGSYGGYFSAHQSFVRSDDPANERGFRLEFNTMLSDKRTSYITGTTNLIATYTGLRGSRSQDRVSAALGVTQINSSLSARSNSGSQSGGREYVAELSYAWKASQAITVQPVVQYIHQPGGLKWADDAWITGAKVVLTL